MIFQGGTWLCLILGHNEGRGGERGIVFLPSLKETCFTEICNVTDALLSGGAAPSSLYLGGCALGIEFGGGGGGGRGNIYVPCETCIIIQLITDPFNNIEYEIHKFPHPSHIGLVDLHL